MKNHIVITILIVGTLWVGSLIALWSYLTIVYNKMLKRAKEEVEQKEILINCYKAKCAEKDKIYAEANAKKQSIKTNDPATTFDNANELLKQAADARKSRKSRKD